MDLLVYLGGGGKKRSSPQKGKERETTFNSTVNCSGRTGGATHKYPLWKITKRKLGTKGGERHKCFEQSKRQKGLSQKC